MSKAQWIWYNGDFELYHSMKLHARREEYGVEYPCFWSLSAPYPTASFAKAYHADEADTLRLVTPHKAYLTIDNVRYAANTDISVPAGDHVARIVILAQEGFPCIYINSKYLVTDGTWVCDHLAGGPVPVGTWDAYTSPEDDPTVFPFAYETLKAVKVENTPEGMLYDFGREMFGIVRFDADPAATVRVVYGESREEATDPTEALIRETVKGKAHYDLAPRAFRYICVKSDGAEPKNVIADYEYLPLTDRASFSCNRRAVQKIWDICAYTLHLNSREFFLDGIKRDRWCWSGDAYQSYKANNYLFFDPAITKRTIVALLGKPPYEQHINSINDYSMYLIIGAYEYYYATGDKQFIEIYYPRLKALYDFIEGRLNEQGYVCYRYVAFSVGNRGIKHSCIELLHRHHSRVREKAFVKLTHACVNGIDLCRSSFKKAVGKATGRSAHIHSLFAVNVYTECVKRRLKLHSASAYVFEYFFDLNLVRKLLVDYNG